MAAVAAASQTKPQTEDLYLKKIHKISALLHQLLEAGGWAGGQPGLREQGVLHPAGAVRVGGVFPLRLSHLPLGAPEENIPLAITEAALTIALEGISCELDVM